MTDTTVPEFPHPTTPGTSGTKFLLTSAVFAFVAIVFLASPLTQVGDSRYTLVVSENLLAGRGMSLDDQFATGPSVNPLTYHVVAAGGHLKYYFPIGSSILSVPFVAAANLLGVHAVNPNLTHNIPAEVRMQHVLASFLMAVMACFFLWTAMLLLPMNLSVIVTLFAVFGSQIWSTASRALWSDTWGLLLLSIAVFLILRSRLHRHSLQPELLGTIVAWMYIVRPTYSVAIASLSIMVFLVDRKRFVRYLLTGAVWGVLFAFFSREIYGSIVPPYFEASRLSTTMFWPGLAGNLFSPSRGLLVYVPSTIVVLGLLVSNWPSVREKDLVLCGILSVVLLLLVAAAFPKWWGGHCYGARLTTGMVPWLFLLTIVSLRYKPNEASTAGRGKRWRMQLLNVLVMILLVLGVAINGRGAISEATHEWNTAPANIDFHTGRLWDWSQPQFLAGL